MKSRNLGFLVLAVILVLSTSSCSLTRNSAESNCPTNDPNYFFKKAGAKPTKYYKRTNQFSQRRYKY